MEEAIPIGVNMSGGGTKTAREILSIDKSALQEKDELTKEERRKERMQKKRKIKSHLHHKEITKKEKNREKGIAQIGDRFMVRQVQQQLDKKKKSEKKNRELGLSPQEAKSSNAYKSGNFFKSLTKISQADKDKKEEKRKFKESGKHAATGAGSDPAKRKHGKI
mmetsp:Transcript_10546/g.17694  ORF Transcript_10546/g.17694 Transcript_10546/m.17694 type:complete len:164 (+) Transcript_10546:966-1457(+)